MVNSSIYNTLFGASKRGGAKSDISDLMNLIVSKKEFFILIFANLITQLGITYYIMERSDKSAFNFKQLDSDALCFKCPLVYSVLKRVSTAPDLRVVEEMWLSYAKEQTTVSGNQMAPHTCFASGVVSRTLK